MRPSSSASIVAALTSLVACSNGPQRPAASEQSAAVPQVASPAAGSSGTPTAARSDGLPNATTGGDGSAIVLNALQPDDAQGLVGELACSFQVEGQNGALLIARADVDRTARAQAVVRNAGIAERLVGRTEGGFGQLEHGTSFGGRGLAVDISPTVRVATGTEEVRQRATLTVNRADGAERTFEGLWNCGP